jgi:hypothetical protein
MDKETGIRLSRVYELVRTAFTANGPQTVYGHYTARLYTDLDPVPSSVIIPDVSSANQSGRSRHILGESKR